MKWGKENLTTTTMWLSSDHDHSGNSRHTVIWLYFALKIFRTLLFCTVLISYAPHIVYETRVKILLLKNIRTDRSIQNLIEYEIKPNYGTSAYYMMYTGSFHICPLFGHTLDTLGTTTCCIATMWLYFMVIIYASWYFRYLLHVIS